MPNIYEKLELSRSATQDEIARSYCYLYKAKYQISNKLFKIKILLDTRSRWDYDQILAVQLRHSSDQDVNSFYSLFNLSPICPIADILPIYLELNKELISTTTYLEKLEPLFQVLLNPSKRMLYDVQLALAEGNSFIDASSGSIKRKAPDDEKEDSSLSNSRKKGSFGTISNDLPRSSGNTFFPISTSLFAESIVDLALKKNHENTF